MHADVKIKAKRRDKLEKLVRYTARGAFSHKRLSQDKNGDLLYELKTAWSDGTSHIKLSPMELIEKFCALIPLPNYNLFRYCGVLAPNSKLRKHIVPNPKAGEVQATSESGDSTPPATRYSWQRLLKRSFGLDLSRCPSCNSENFKAVAMIEDPDVVQKILLAVGLEARAPPIAPPRSAQQLEYAHYFDG